jgi:hypothetical protein
MRCCLPSLRPAAFPPPSPPPISVGFVRCFIGTVQPSDSSSVPRQLRLLDFLSRPGIAQATAGQTRSPRFRRDPSIRDVALRPRQGDGSSHNGTAHVAFDCSESLGPCEFKDFVAQSHTPHDHCVRFVMVVAFHKATLVTGRALPLSRTGLSPAGPRPLRLAHRYSFIVVDSHRLLLAGLPAHLCENVANSCWRATKEANLPPSESFMRKGHSA